MVGGLIVPPLFTGGYFPMKKRGLEVWNVMTFSKFIMNFQKSKKKWIFTVFWGDLEGADIINPHPLLKQYPAAPHKG